MRIIEITAVTEELIAACDHLLPQLQASGPIPTKDDLTEIVASEHTVLLGASVPEAGSALMGLLTLVLYRIPTGLCARIEDVVVDRVVRGKGIGTALIQSALEQAAQAGATNVDLTSRPEREAANRLYARLGFRQRDTNVYRYVLREASLQEAGFS